MYKQNMQVPIITLAAALVLSGCAATGGLNGSGSASTGNTAPKEFPAHFSRTTTFGNFDVNNPRLAEGQPDGQYAVVETHGSLTLDIGSGLSFLNGSGNDVFVTTEPDRNANYTVHVSHAEQGDQDWTEIGRGYGTEGFDFHSHDAGYSDYVQIRNEGSEPLYLDGVKATYVRRD